MPSLTVLVPCYNEASRGIGVGTFVNRLRRIKMQLVSLDYRVLLMDDGSTDDSVEVFNSFVKSNGLGKTWRCVTSEKNRGKGDAVKRGLELVETDYVLLLDADLSVEPSNVVKLMETAAQNKCYIGSRYAENSKIVNWRPLLRRFVSFCCRLLVDLMFGLGVSDTQCGFKLLPTSACKEVTSYVKNTWLYDVEILYNLWCMNLHFIDVPVRWDNMERESNINAIFSILPSTWALFKLFFKKKAIEKQYSWQH